MDIDEIKKIQQELKTTQDRLADLIAQNRSSQKHAMESMQTNFEWLKNYKLKTYIDKNIIKLSGTFDFALTERQCSYGNTIRNFNIYLTFQEDIFYLQVNIKFIDDMINFIEKYIPIENIILDDDAAAIKISFMEKLKIHRADVDWLNNKSIQVVEYQENPFGCRCKISGPRPGNGNIIKVGDIVLSYSEDKSLVYSEGKYETTFFDKNKMLEFVEKYKMAICVGTLRIG